MEENTPKVFICHASEDKDRFVLNFATKLREKGIDAWIDKWEMKLGDSLVGKIFEEGIKRCDTFIIILSKNSVAKKWVREELDSAVVKRIEDRTKLIPIVIDEDIEIPQSIKHVLRKTIKNLCEYEEDFKEVVMSIYEESNKPVLGDKPRFTITTKDAPGMPHVDSVVLQIAGNIIYEKDAVGRLVNVSDVIAKCAELEISKQMIIDSLEVLESQGFWDISRTISGMEYSRIIFTPFGFTKYCEFFLKGFDDIFREVISKIINENVGTSEAMSVQINCKLVVINSILDYFEKSGYIIASHDMGSKGTHIVRVEAEGRRYFQKFLE